MSNLSGIVREGWLKRTKNQKKRYFVLGFNKDTGDAQLQYYENPKKFSSESDPKRVISLQQCLGIVRKVDDRFGNILVLYTKEAVFRLKADTDDLLECWLTDLDKLLKMEYKNLQELKYDIVWNVKVVSRGLGGLKNITGSYKLCLKDNTLYFINPITQDVVIEEKLYHVRKFGYWEHFLFMEFGRSTALGPGEIWMEAEDSLIAQKIEDSLSRSVKPKSRPKSVAEPGSLNLSSAESPVDNENNNTESPKSRRATFFKKITPKKSKQKDCVSLRPHSNSMSERTPPGSTEKVFIDRNGSLPKTGHLGEEEDSEDKHYPKITPPVPSTGRPKQGKAVESTEGDNNEYANIGPGNVPRQFQKRSGRSRKHKPNEVREDFKKEYTSSSLPRRTSSSSSSEPSWRHSIGEKFPPSYDSDGTREYEDGDNAFHLEMQNQYIAMKPRPSRINSDSSIDEANASETFDSGTYLSLKPPDLYVQMTTPNSDKSRNTSARSSGSYYSSEEGGGAVQPSAYVNMAPGSVKPSHVESRSSSSDDLPVGDTERFDHLNRDASYVNMRLGGLKKSHSQIQNNPRSSSYVNVDITRSKSMGSSGKKFHIVPESKLASKNENEMPSIPSYVNVKTNGTETPEADANYANITPQNQKMNVEKSPGRKGRDLNYASVEFSKDSPPRERGSPRRAKNTEDNYSKIDFEKSNVLANIASGRERQLHHT